MSPSIPKNFLKSIQIAEKVFNEVEDFLRPGLSEKEVASFIRKSLKKNGAQKESFKIIVASGPRSALIHGFSSDRVIKKDDIVMLDFGALYKGFRSDITRTYLLGKPNEKQRRIHALLFKAQRSAITKVKAGVPAKIIDKTARDIIEKSGFGKYFRHSTGHGIRNKVHEPPHVNQRSESILKDGDVITIEPGIYMDNWGGMRIEDMVLVTKKGCKVLTKVHRNKRLELKK